MTPMERKAFRLRKKGRKYRYIARQTGISLEGLKKLFGIRPDWNKQKPLTKSENAKELERQEKRGLDGLFRMNSPERIRFIAPYMVTNWGDL
jgi:hypothetical protein